MISYILGKSLRKCLGHVLIHDYFQFCYQKRKYNDEIFYFSNHCALFLGGWVFSLPGYLNSCLRIRMHQLLTGSYYKNHYFLFNQFTHAEFIQIYWVQKVFIFRNSQIMLKFEVCKLGLPFVYFTNIFSNHYQTCILWVD